MLEVKYTAQRGIMAIGNISEAATTSEAFARWLHRRRAPVKPLSVGRHIISLAVLCCVGSCWTR